MALLLPLFAAAPAFAENWFTAEHMGFQPAASPTMERITDFHTLLLWIVSTIVAFVLFLLLFICVRFNAKANPVPSKTTHNTLLEIFWTAVPLLILVGVAVPSLKLLYYADRTTSPELTLKVTGYQWYWGYEYKDQDGLTFMSYMLPDEKLDAAKGQKRLLSTDNPVVLPVDTNIQILVTASDVIHSFAVPALGLKTDAVPGRLNETWVRITKPGTYYGQCSELCGKDHAFMPIEIRAVSKEEFAAWVEQAKKQFADNGAPATITLANAEGLE